VNLPKGMGWKVMLEVKKTFWIDIIKQPKSLASKQLPDFLLIAP